MLDFAGRALVLAAALGVAAGPAVADHKRKPRPHKPHAAPAAAPMAHRPDGPPHARPGECYARLHAPAHAEIYTEKVLVEPGRTERREVPPRYRKAPHELVVREEERRTEVIPPVIDTVSETVLVRPGGERRYVEPAQTAVVHETVPVEGPRLVWKLVHSPLHPTPVWCLIEAPARTASVARTVVVRPEIARTVITPPEYAVLPRQVVRVPGSSREVVIPPQTRTVYVDELLEPGRVEETVVEPRYETVTRSKHVAPTGYGGWVRVLCEEHATPHRIKRLQGALHKRGHYRGPIDGKYGPATADGVRRFQAERNLRHDGYLSWPTLEALDVPHDDMAVGPPRRLAPGGTVGR